MIHEEVDIINKKYDIKASLLIPNNSKSKIGIVLSHGGIINRQSLLRKSYCFAQYLCEELDAYVIAPDFFGETLHIEKLEYSNLHEILTITTNWLVDKYDLESVSGFGHSLGSYVLAESLTENRHLDTIVTYGGPILELQGKSQNRFTDYLIKYMMNYNYSINIRNILKQIFDKETSRYMEEVMLKDSDFNSQNYIFDFNFQTLKYYKKISTQYLDILKKWNKPALLLFGTDDGVTKRTIKHYKNETIEKNINVKHVFKASHVTPCMDSRYQLQKLRIVPKYVRNMTPLEVEINK